MATLIQSKQIEGIVTSSIIDGVFIVSGSQILTGSLFVDGDITASGVIEASEFVGDGSRLTGVVATGTGVSFETGSDLAIITKFEISGSGIDVNIINSNTASITIDYTDITQLNTFTQSIDGRVDSLENWSSSLGDTFATDLEVQIVSSSVAATINIISQNTGLVTTSSFNAFTQSYRIDSSSFDNRIEDLEASIGGGGTGIGSRVDILETSSIELFATASNHESRIDLLELNTGSQASQLSNLQSFTSSQETKNSTLSTYTASINDNISNIHAFTASFGTTFSSSVDNRLDLLEGFSSSLDSSFATDIELAAVSASISASQTFISSSISTSLNALSQSSGFINYVTNSIQNLTGIEVADFDSNTAVTFTNGVLKFIFGTPTAPTSIAASLSGFATDRFNRVNDSYTINGSWNNQGYTLVSASLYEGSTLLTQVGSGTSLSYAVTTSGSHTYQLQYTASSPLDGSIYSTATTTTGTVSKTNPASPSISSTPTVQLGFSSNQMEQGATGSITFTTSSANPSNSWNLTSVTSNVSSPYQVTGSATGSSSISITATANYASPTGDNSPDLTTTSTATTTYTKIRSLRYGASSQTSFTAPELENLALWDTTLGGTIGTIVKGTTTASGQSVTISWTGDKFHYIVFNSSLSNLSNITTSGFGVLGQFSVTTVGQYKVYKTNTLQAGGGGSSITYVLT
jgi:hypothetical protein